MVTLLRYRVLLTASIATLVVIFLSGCFHDDDSLPSDFVGDTVDTAFAVDPGASQDARINTVDDIDVFSFTLNSPGSLFVHTTGDLDTIGELFFVDAVFGVESIVSANDDISVATGNLNFQVSGETLPAGTYFVRVVPFPGSSLGPYTLISSLDAIGDTIATAFPVTSGVVQNSEINGGQDIDMYEIVCLAVCNITATTSGSTDTIGRLLDASGGVLDTSDDISFPDNLNFTLSGNSLAAASYFVEVSGFGATSGPYSLVVTAN